MGYEKDQYATVFYAWNEPNYYTDMFRLSYGWPKCEGSRKMGLSGGETDRSYRATYGKSTVWSWRKDTVYDPTGKDGSYYQLPPNDQSYFPRLSKKKKKDAPGLAGQEHLTHFKQLESQDVFSASIHQYLQTSAIQTSCQLP